MDDFNEDWDNDFDDGGKDNLNHDDDDDGLDEIFNESEIEDDPYTGDDTPLEVERDHRDGLQWQDFMIIGPLSEEISRERRERERLIRRNKEGK